MPRTENSRGSRRLHARDWPFGSQGRRLFLEAVLLEAPPERGWRKSELEDAASVEHGGVDRLLSGAQTLDLVRWDGRNWHRRDPQPPVAGPLELLVKLARELPDEP